MKLSLIRHSLLFILFSSVIFCQGIAQSYIPRAERGDPAARRKTNIDTNNIRTTVFNFGFTGRTGVVPDEVPYEWPKNTKRMYMALAAMFIGGEVRDSRDSLIHIVDVPNYRQNPSGGSWNLEPVPEYQNPASTSIARSDDPSTWPSLWPDKAGDTTDPGWAGSWNGFRGKNQFINGQEFYFHYSDDRYDRYSYYPDATDSTRRGLGIVGSRRVMEFTDSLVNDVIFFIDDIYNAGTKNIDKAAVTYWMADLIGGDGDSGDDHAYYNHDTSAVIFTDSDGRGNRYFGPERVGVAAFSLLETPSSLGITGVRYIAAGAINFNTTPDSYFWNTFMTAGLLYNPIVKLNGDYDGFVSCGPFPLDAGLSQRLVSAIALAYDSQTVEQKIEYAKIFAKNGFQQSGPAITISSPSHDTIIAGTFNIIWNTVGADTALRIDIYLTTDMGTQWQLLAANLPNSGSYLWPSSSVPDGIMNQIRVVTHGQRQLSSRNSAGYFRVNNNINARPQARITSLATGSVFANQMSIRYFAGDADTSGVHLTIVSSFDNFLHTDTVFSQWVNNGAGEFNWDIASLPNSAYYRLKAFSQNDDTTTTDSTGTFAIDNPRHPITLDTPFVHRTTKGTGTIEVHIVDTTQLNGHRYSVQFKQSGADTVYDVVDETVSHTVLQNIPDLEGYAESPVFDGMRLYVRNDSLPIAYPTNSSAPLVKSITVSWNRIEVPDVWFSQFRRQFSWGDPEIGDYVIRVGNPGIDSSRPFSAGTLRLQTKAVNFSITNLLTGKKTPFAFWELDGNNGAFTFSSAESDVIILLKEIRPDSLVASWMIKYLGTTGATSARAGDSVIIVVPKPFLPGDRYTFTSSLGTLDVGEEGIPSAYALEQNYPNPFNPQTMISFTLGKREFVRLEVYNIIGQKVRTLINGDVASGAHTITWDGRDARGKAVSSGVYFYRIEAGSFRETRKMTLVR